ncbi:MAG: Asp-tRNA(Asn)/Glu-tRNA(Gln) amidotransferase subunit GatC [Acidobacteria bacterium]|nr:Asp-tRNA(Asn)/Glu-tRNA(Gln) amidotransferase subunit GatC [Acidobacteriota bacterium]MCZ6769193.1 Asp-tRNA(Asn)/Glu-tRNA(Gln) amidotransferase subunit GatC [Acidobacteriota bacterium]MCZ6877385.1 Asp-tRNA(Asn)/Glu-tRNA(Gln) amidotransferase subunit GatC [Acidobacteriota bacterium]
MPISTGEVEKIADLAKLKFDAQELERFVDQFQEILEYIAKLEAVPTEEVEPTYQALEQEDLATPTREDEVKPCFPVGTALANAPDSSEDHFRVPPVIE